MDLKQILIWWRALATNLIFRTDPHVSERSVASLPAGEGFNLLFTDNTREFEDVCVRFEKPLQSWIRGKWIRNGLGKFGMGERNFSHIFDAFGKLTSMTLAPPNKLLFTHKFLKTESYMASTAQNDIIPYVFISETNPPLNYFEKISGLLRGADNVDVNVIKYGGVNGQYVALSDVWKSYEFDGESLNKVRVVDPHFEGQRFLSKWIPDPSAAHPMKVSGNNDYINYVAEVSPFQWVASKMSLVRIKTTTTRDIITSWSVRRVSYIHSFAMSENWAIIPEHPMYVNTNNMLKYATLLKTLSWEPDKPTTFRVVNIHSGEMVTIHARFAVFFMHHINSFEVDHNTIVSEFVVYDDFSFIASFEREILIDRKKKKVPTATLR